MEKYRVKYFLMFILFTLIFAACEKEQQETRILTEDILYLSGEKIRLSGRLYSIEGQELDNHGFLIAEDENFTSPEVIDLGTKANLGLFIGETDNLLSQRKYFYRAFGTIGGQNFYGETKTTNTLKPSIKSFSPEIEYAGNRLVIDGTNFTKNTKVFFDDQEAQILEIKLESLITVKIPEKQGNYLPTITVIVNDETLAFEEPFEYVTGEWRFNSHFITDLRIFECAYFVNGTNFIYGLGRNHNGSVLNRDFWKLDLTNWQWESLSFTGTGVRGPFFNNAGYIGGGAIEWTFEHPPTMGNELWKYDEDTMVFIGNLPFELFKSVSFSIDDVAYVGGGFSNDGLQAFQNNILYRYNESQSIWIEESIMPFDFDADLPLFVYKKKPYFISKDRSVWVFDSFTKEWTIVGEFPGILKFRGITEVISSEGKAYIGLFLGDNKIWEYEIEENSWKIRERFPDRLEDFNSASFTYGSKIYVMRMNPATSEPMELWEFDPKCF